MTSQRAFISLPGQVVVVVCMTPTFASVPKKWKVQQSFDFWQVAIAQHFFLFVSQEAVNTGLNVIFAGDLESFLA